MDSRKRLRQKQESFLFILMGLILLGLLISGYFLFVEKVLPGISSSKGTASSIEASKNVSSTTSSSAAESENSGEIIPGDSQEITLYFGQKGKDQLVREVRKIPAEKMILKLASSLIKCLLRGPITVSEARSLLPVGTELRSIFYNQGTFYVDFSREFIDNHSGGALEEVLTIFSVVNTLTELDRKAKIRILVNGVEVDTLKGHVNLRQVFSRNESFVGDNN